MIIDFKRFTNPEFVYEPYPMGVVQGFFSECDYQILASSFPSKERFSFLKAKGSKYSLSEVNNSASYYAFLKENPHWMSLYRALKSEQFIPSVFLFLKHHMIDLGISYKRQFPLFWRKNLSTRFEFSLLPASGGHILPHTDAPNKIVTLVVAMCLPDEWDGAWGGGTSMLRPKDITRNYNHTNRYLSFDETAVIRTFPFVPNQCLFFIKTFNSLHAVAPMTGTVGMRKTLTINIERHG